MENSIYVVWSSIPWWESLLITPVYYIGLVIIYAQFSAFSLYVEAILVKNLKNWACWTRTIDMENGATNHISSPVSPLPRAVACLRSFLWPWIADGIIIQLRRHHFKFQGKSNAMKQVVPSLLLESGLSGQIDKCNKHGAFFNLMSPRSFHHIWVPSIRPVLHQPSNAALP